MSYLLEFLPHIIIYPGEEEEKKPPSMPPPIFLLSVNEALHYGNIDGAIEILEKGIKDTKNSINLSELERYKFSSEEQIQNEKRILTELYQERDEMQVKELAAIRYTLSA